MEDAKPTVLNEIANLDSIMEHVLSFSELDSERVVA
jgi:hypothetical protein